VSVTDRRLAASAAKLGRALHARGWRLATAESCTGGWIAKAVTDVGGASRWFEGGVVTYSNAAKTNLLAVPRRLLSSTGPGAVSQATVRAMAEGARAGFGVEIAVAVSGVAGPDGGTAKKPVGTVWFAWAMAGRTLAERHVFAGDRAAVRRATVALALERLIELAAADD
jgi:nicotinamide-nucleotide amidase